ncbi:MAG: HEAT repeat domain-containing protein [Verrucomicrobia bacterium]|nr:HEAT repeat domain-containing protein [Verrucomicrobiota bacterium]
MASPPPTTSPPPLPAPRSPRRLWLGIGAVVLVLAAAVAWVVIHRNSPSGLEQRVQAIFNEVRRQNVNRVGFIERVLESLPGPFANLGGRYASRNIKGTHEFAEELAKLGTNTVPILVRTLGTDRHDAVREVCARALGDLAARSALPALTNALARDSTENVRSAAGTALEEIGDPAALPALRTALRGETAAAVRATVVSALAALGQAQIVPDLLAAGRQETNWTVRASLARALADAQEPQAIGIIATWLNEKPPAGRSGLPAGYNPNTYVMREVIHALGELGGEPVFQLLAERWQNEPAKEIRTAICEVFGALADPRALPMLREALEEEDETRAAAVAAMGQLGDTNAVPPLTTLLDDANRDVRRNAATALGHLRGAAGVPTLLRMLTDDANDERRAGVARALGEIGDPAALDPLLKVLPQMVKERENVVWALGHLGRTNAVPALVAALRSKEREESFAAAYALVEIGGAAGGEALAANLADKDEYARHGKACALAMLGRNDGLATVRAGLRAKEPWRRFGATLALARLSIAADSPEWEPILNDTDAALRRLGHEAAAGRVVPALTALLRDRKRDYRQYAARGLLFFRDPAALPALREAFKDRDPSVRDAARLAVQFIERSEREKK